MVSLIMVAHRLNSIRNCDRILVLDKDTLAEEGTHAQLMEHSGLLAAMYSSMSRSPLLRLEDVLADIRQSI